MTTSNTMREALLRVGITPSLRRSTSTSPLEETDVVYIDPRAMADIQIVDEVAALRLHTADIKRQLEDDKDEGIARGEFWRARARKALRAKLFRLEQLEAEAQGRGLIAALPRLAEKLALKAAHDAIERAKREADRLAKEERAKAHEERLAADSAKREAKEAQRVSLEQKNRTQCEMFVKAAYQLHSRDVCDRIWRRAKEMFPGNPAWREL